LAKNKNDLTENKKRTSKTRVFSGTSFDGRPELFFYFGDVFFGTGIK